MTLNLHPDRLSTWEEFLRATGDTPERLAEIHRNAWNGVRMLSEDGTPVELGELELAFLLGFDQTDDDSLN